MHIEDLSKDVLLYIFSYLPYSLLKKVILVSRKFKQIGENPWLWRKFKLSIDNNNLKHLNRILNLRRLHSVEEVKFQDCRLKNSHVKTLMKSKVKSLVLGNDTNFDEDVSTEDINPNLFAKMLSRLLSISINNWDYEFDVEIWKALLEHSASLDFKLKSLKIIVDLCFNYDFANVIPSLFTRLNNLTLNFQKSWSLSPLFHQLALSGNLHSLNLAYSNLLDVPEETFSAVLAKVRNVDISYCRVSAAQVIHLFSTRTLKTQSIIMHGIEDEYENSTLYEIPENILTKFLIEAQEKKIEILH